MAHAGSETWSDDSYHHVVKRACRPGMRVLDLGCGSGHAAKNLADREVDYTGIGRRTAELRPMFAPTPLYDLRLPEPAVRRR